LETSLNVRPVYRHTSEKDLSGDKLATTVETRDVESSRILSVRYCC